MTRAATGKNAMKTLLRLLFLAMIFGGSAHATIYAVQDGAGNVVNCILWDEIYATMIAAAPRLEPKEEDITQ